MNQVMVEEMPQYWLELAPRITETYIEQPLPSQEEYKYMIYFNEYVVQDDQHILVY